jgi:hypothetical protein
VVVAGTTGNGDDIASQTREALRRIEIALRDAGATFCDVIRTQMYVTDIASWRDVEVSALNAPELSIELDADAYVGGPADD